MAQRRNERELEELRKQGLAMPERDESGQLINPHIPSYITAQPWYLTQGNAAPSLKHQRADTHANRDIQTGIDAQRMNILTKDTISGQKFRKGACTNCGAMDHTAGTCLERPKTNTAKYANTTYSEVDKFVSVNKLSYEAKRDKFSQFSTDEWVLDLKKRQEEERQQLAVLKQMQEEDAKQKTLKAAELAAQQPPVPSKLTSSSLLIDSDYDTDDELDDVIQQSSDTNTITKSEPTSLSLEDRIKLNPKLAAAAGSFLSTVLSNSNDKKKSISGLGFGIDAHGTAVQSLRTQGDVPKYLLNLDEDNVYYDPKTHSMRENPFQPSDPRYQEYENKYRSHLYAPDEFKELEHFAFEFKEITGKEINPFVNPTLVRQLKLDYEEMKNQTQLSQQQVLLSLYGDAQQEDGDKDDMRVKKQRTDLGSVTGQVSMFLDDNTTDLYDNDNSDPNDPNALVILSSPTDAINISTQSPTVVIISSLDPSKATSLIRLSSKYPENVLEVNHAAIWGSYYNIKDGKWGYSCCQSCTRQSYCVPLPTATKRK